VNKIINIDNAHANETDDNEDVICRGDSPTDLPVYF